MKPVKAWAVVAPWGDPYEHYPSFLTPILFKVRRDAETWRHNHAGNERIVRVEIRAIENKRNATPVGGRKKASSKSRGDSQ